MVVERFLKPLLLMTVVEMKLAEVKTVWLSEVCQQLRKRLMKECIVRLRYVNNRLLEN